MGTKMATVVNTNAQESGEHEISTDLSHLPKGIYLYTIETNKGRTTEKLVIR